jgi:hypothetical protein
MTPFAHLVAADPEAARTELLRVFKLHGCRAHGAGVALGFNGRRRFDHFVALLGLQQTVDKLRTAAHVRGEGQRLRAQRRYALDTIGRDEVPADLFEDWKD